MKKHKKQTVMSSKCRGCKKACQYGRVATDKEETAGKYGCFSYVREV